MPTDNKQLFRTLYREYDRRKGLPVEFYAPNFVAHLPGVPPLDLKGFEGLVASMFDAFPDMLHDVEDLVAEGDRVGVRATLRGTHRGPFRGLPASGNPVAIAVCALFRVADDKLVEEWAVIDQADLLNQMKGNSTGTKD